MKIFRNTFLVISLIITFISGVFASENTVKRAKRAEQKLDIKVTAWGPAQ